MTNARIIAAHGPAENAAEVDLSSGDVAVGARALYVGTGGNLEITTSGGDKVVLEGIPNGAFVPVAVSIIHSANTTAAAIVALS